MNVTGWTSPTVIGWAVALLVGGILTALVMAPERSPVASSKGDVVGQDAEVLPTPVPEPDANVAAGEPAVVVPAEQPPVEEQPATPRIPQIVFDRHSEPPVSALDAVPAALPPAVARQPNIEAVLNQRLSRFDQSKPASRRSMLKLLEDLTGRRIEWDGDALQTSVAGLDEEVTFSLENVTVADLISQIFAGTELQLVITDDGARLQRRTGDDSIVLPAGKAP